MEQTLLQETSLLAEESKSAAIAVRLAMITDDVLHQGMADLVGRTGNALTAMSGTDTIVRDQAKAVQQ